MNDIINILNKTSFSKHDIITLLNTTPDQQKVLFDYSQKIKEQQVGNVVYYRGLIEMSNICSKSCYYCGIRTENNNVQRYNLSDNEIIEAVKFAHQNRYASVVLQAGELISDAFTTRIEHLVNQINALTHNEIGITLSLGEQTPDTYQRWFNAGAHRYLLRIESSNPLLYQRIHPQNSNHSFETRLQCLRSLKSIGFQVGSGVMMGLPFQTIDDMANDLLFLKQFDIDMCGMGPYIEHADTPLYEYRSQLISKTDRLNLALKMIAILRIMMPDINIAAATALQAIDPMGREKAIKIGANIIMPNITPGKYRDSYKLYENKPCTDEEADDCTRCLEARISMVNNTVGYGQWGDSKHFKK
jgi:biotin synthase